MTSDIQALKAKLAAIERLPAKHAGVSYLNFDATKSIVARELDCLTGVSSEHLRLEHRLVDIGLDALGRVGLALAMEQKASLAVELDSSGWMTIGDVVDAVRRTPRAL